jgi:hypothetical protein
LASVGCAGGAVQVERPQARVQQWNAAVENGDCEALGSMLHPARYGAVSRASFIATCQELGDNQRRSLFRASMDETEEIEAELTTADGMGDAVRLKNDGNRWLLVDLGGSSLASAKPAAVLRQLHRLASSELLADTIALMAPESQHQYAQELRLVRQAIEEGQRGNIDIRGNMATATFESVTIVMRRQDDGQWYFESIR